MPCGAYLASSFLATSLNTAGWPPPWSPMIITFLKPVMIACSAISVEHLAEDFVA